MNKKSYTIGRIKKLIHTVPRKENVQKKNADLFLPNRTKKQPHFFALFYPFVRGQASKPNRRPMINAIPQIIDRIQRINARLFNL